VGNVADHGVTRHESIHAERWTLAGTTKVVAEADVGVAELQGTVAIGGALSAGSFHIVGDLDAGGAVEVQAALYVEGHLRTRASVHAGDLEVRGGARCAGEVRADRGLTVRGTLTAPSLRAATLTLHGSAEVPGDIEAQQIDGHFQHDSRLGRVRARSVRFRGKVSNLVDKALFRHADVTIERIEADKVELEAVHVVFVRAPEIIVGRDASVGEVEGTIVRRHPTSHVGPQSKSRPPFGLRR
jgi:cytoskeletal protein CcmA (bactofilin family)